MSETITPLVPPLSAAELPPVGGAIGSEPEDFIVDEVPLYAASGQGEHLYVQIKKRNLTTRDAVRRIAEAAGVHERDIGTAGMKDKHAVTTQWLSLLARGARAPDTWSLPEGLEVIEATRHGNKLRTGHLLGNRFRIRIVGGAPDGVERATRIARHITTRGMPNSFGAQRFGFDGDNLAAAFRWLDREVRAGKKGTIPPFERKLYSSVVQSEVFNRYLVARLAEGLDRPIAGEVVRLEGTSSLFVVDEPEREAPRWASRDIHPSGPIVGPKMKPARDRALALEEGAMNEAGLDADLSAHLGRYADGTRRDVLLFPKEFNVAAAPDGVLVLDFFLPTGSYATEVVRELTRHPFFGKSRPNESMSPA